MIEALGHRVLIEPDPIEEITTGGIIIAQTDDYVRQEKAATSTGTVIDYGPAAWLDPLLGGEPWVERGDRVVYARYSGKFVTDPDNNKEYVVINDDAIQARVVSENRKVDIGEVAA